MNQSTAPRRLQRANRHFKMEHEDMSWHTGETEYGPMILLLLLLLGLHSNISLASLLKTHWRRLSNMKIVMSICVSANTLALFFDIHKPLNSILQVRNMAGQSAPRHWIFGQFLCEVLLPVSKLSLAASVTSWCALAHCYFHTKVYNYRLTKSGTETLVFLVWAIAATLTAPCFCTQALVYDGESRAEICLTVWASRRLAKLNDAWLVVLQYAIPIASIMSSVIKTMLYGIDHKETPRWYPFVACCVDLLSIVCVLVVTYLIPFGVDGFGQRFQHSMPVIDPRQTLRFLESFALSVCLAVPFILRALIKRELMEKPEPRENSSEWKLQIEEASKQNEIV